MVMIIARFDCHDFENETEEIKNTLEEIIIHNV